MHIATLSELLLRRRLQQETPPSEYDLAWEITTTQSNTEYTIYLEPGSSMANVYWGEDDQMSILSPGNASNLTYTYSTPGTYIVELTGSNISRFQAGVDQASKNLVTRVLNMNLAGYGGSYTEILGEFYNCTNLTSFAPGCILGPRENMTGTFSGCVNLAGNIPNLSNLASQSGLGIDYAFKNCSSLTGFAPGFSIDSTVVSLRSTFEGCSSLPYIPAISGSFIYDLRDTFNGCSSATHFATGFKIPGSVSYLNSAFKNTLALQEIPSSIWPTYFLNHDVDISQMFYRDTVQAGIPTGTLPAGVLWEDPVINFNATDAFKNCTSLSNYDDIPSTWK